MLSMEGWNELLDAAEAANKKDYERHLEKQKHREEARRDSGMDGGREEGTSRIRKRGDEAAEETGDEGQETDESRATKKRREDDLLNSDDEDLLTEGTTPQTGGDESVDQLDEELDEELVVQSEDVEMPESQRDPLHGGQDEDKDDEDNGLDQGAAKLEAGAATGANPEKVVPAIVLDVPVEGEEEVEEEESDSDMLVDEPVAKKKRTAPTVTPRTLPPRTARAAAIEAVAQAAKGGVARPPKKSSAKAGTPKKAKATPATPGSSRSTAIDIDGEVAALIKKEVSNRVGTH